MFGLGLIGMVPAFPFVQDSYGYIPGSQNFSDEIHVTC